MVLNNYTNIVVLPTDYMMDKTLRRISQDKIVNINGRRLLEFCKTHGLRICNGRLGSDLGIGNYTYVDSSGKNVVDYVLVSPLLFDHFSTFEVGEPNILSDHCAIQFSVRSKTHMKTRQIGDACSFSNINKKYIWKDENVVQYEYNLLILKMISSTNWTHNCNRPLRLSI